MNDEQYKRYRKMESDSIRCLYKTCKKDTLHFLISGSRDVNYKVSIPRDGKISCSCPDFKHGASECECVCKHCLYVIYKEIRLFKSLDHTFFKRLYFTPDEVEKLHVLYRNSK